MSAQAARTALRHPSDIAKQELIRLDHLCLARLVPIDHVRALVVAGRLPAPPIIAEDGIELVQPEYLPPEPDPPWVESAFWREHVGRELARLRTTRERLLISLDDGDDRRRGLQLSRMGSNAWGVGLSLVMGGKSVAAREWFDRAARYYRHSLADAEAGSWGRSLATIKARILADDDLGAVREARWTLELGAAEQRSAIAVYSACLAELTLGTDDKAASQAGHLLNDADFPVHAAKAVSAIATHDEASYARAIAELLTSFEKRDRYLESIPAADTVLVLQSLAHRRNFTVSLRSPVLPTSG